MTRKNRQLHPIKKCTSGVERQSRRKVVPKDKTNTKVLRVTMLLPNISPGKFHLEKTEKCNNRVYQFTGDKIGNRQNVFTS
jgi:hypothetical protein